MGRGAQAQSRTVRVNKNMPADRPRACLAPLPCTLFEAFHVVFGHVNLRCDRQALKRRTMVRSMPIRMAAKIWARSGVR